MSALAATRFPPVPLWAPANSPADRYQPDDIVETKAFGKTRRWRCKLAHRPALARSPLRKAGERYWEQSS